jgi:hypothetical protein
MLGDLLLEQSLRLVAGADPREKPGADAASEELRPGAFGEHRDDAHAEDARQDFAQPVAAPLVADAQHDAQDHFERDRPHVGQGGVRLADRPAADVLERRRADQLAVAVQRLAVERREQQAAQAQVPLAVRHEDGPAGRGADQPVRLAGAQDVGIAGEDLLDQDGIVDGDESSEAEDPQRHERRNRRTQWSVKRSVKKTPRTVCTGIGRRGPGGRPGCAPWTITVSGR